LDGEVDPYVVYVVDSSLKDDSATVYRRYKQFKDLAKKMGKNLPKKAVLPPPSSKFGSRNLTWEFVSERRKTLQEFLKGIVEDENARTQKVFLEWLGLGREKDPVYDETYKRAFEKTKWDLWLWKKIVYDSEGEGLSKLIIEEIKRDMWSDVTSSIPPDPKLRRAAMKGVYRALNTMVEPPVTTGFNAVRAKTKDLREPIKQKLEEALDKVLEIEEQIKNKLKEAMTSALAPVLENLKPFIGELLKAISNPVIKGITIVASERDKLDSQMRDALSSGDTAKVRSLVESVSGLRAKVSETINHGLQEFLSSVLGDLKTKVTVEALSHIFEPLEKIVKIAESFFNLIDPGNWGEVVIVLMEEKDKILQGGVENANRHMDWEEWEIRWHYWWKGYDIWRYGYYLYWELWGLMYQLGPIADWFLDVTYDYRHIHRKTLKKFSWKFGDYLYGFINDPTDSREFKDKVNAALVIGYERARKHFVKHTKIYLHKNVRRFLKRPIIQPIHKLIHAALDPVLEPIQSAIVSPADQILDVKQLVIKTLEETVEDCLDHILNDLEIYLMGELAKAGIIQAIDAKPVIVEEDRKDKEPVVEEEHHHHDGEEAKAELTS